MSRNTVIIGIGNMYRGDDAIGLLAADELINSGINVIKASGDATELMETWEGYDKAILIDACPYMEETGKIHRVNINEDENILTDSIRSSSHNFGISEAIEFSRLLRSLPEEVIIYAVEGERFEQGDEVSDKVMSTIQLICEQIRQEITEEKSHA